MVDAEQHEPLLALHAAEVDHLRLELFAVIPPEGKPHILSLLKPGGVVAADDGGVIPVEGQGELADRILVDLPLRGDDLPQALRRKVLHIVGVHALIAVHDGGERPALRGFDVSHLTRRRGDEIPIGRLQFGEIILRCVGYLLAEYKTRERALSRVHGAHTVAAHGGGQGNHRVQDGFIPVRIGIIPPGAGQSRLNALDLLRDGIDLLSAAQRVLAAVDDGDRLVDGDLFPFFDDHIYVLGIALQDQLVPHNEPAHGGGVGHGGPDGQRRLHRIRDPLIEREPEIGRHGEKNQRAHDPHQGIRFIH